MRFLNSSEKKTKTVTRIWHDVHGKFKHAKELKDQLVSSFEDKLGSLCDLECGYMEKKSQRWLENDKDIEVMYKTFKPGDEITLWCDGTLPESTKSTRDGKKRKSDDSTDEPPSKRKANEDTVDEITKTLQEKHGETWSTPQYRLWARMKHNGQHSCLDTPPSIPMFSGTTSKPPRRESLSDAITSAATAVVGLIKGNDSTSAALSPGKRARVSGQYLEHLEKLRHLHELGVMSSDEFEEQKSFALNNIRELNK